MAKRNVDSQIVAGMVHGLQRKDIARSVGVSERTLRRRLSEPAMVEAIAAAQAEVQRELNGRLNGLAHRALTEIEQLLGHGPNTVKVQVAKLILEQRVVQRQVYEDALLDLAEASHGESLQQLAVRHA